MNAGNKTTRMANIELLRVVSMIMILFLHLFGQGEVLDHATNGIVIDYRRLF